MVTSQRYIKSFGIFFSYEEEIEIEIEGRETVGLGMFS